MITFYYNCWIHHKRAQSFRVLVVSHQQSLNIQMEGIEINSLALFVHWLIKMQLQLID